MIDHYHPSHKGFMPIRVLQHNLSDGFERLNSEFLSLTKQMIAAGKLDPGISLDLEEAPIKIPSTGFGKLFIHEAFLSYIWCIAFSLAVLHDEVIGKRSRNEYFQNNDETTDMELSRAAYRLWEYAVSLIRQYQSWDTTLPNPEKVEECHAQVISRVNGLYLTAMHFILAHEFAHIELEHNSRSLPALSAEEENTVFEKEADKRAMELVMAGATPENTATLRFGVLIGLCSLLFFSSVTKHSAYPDTDDRIDEILRLINPEQTDAMWGIATLAYRLWDNHYHVGCNGTLTAATGISTMISSGR